MNKKCFRFFGGLIASQEKWLNKMAAEGFRLVSVSKLRYEFEPCAQGQYEYRVEFIGGKSKESAEDYVRFLEDCGYRVFFKNINLNWSVGKVKARPWAEKGGRIATNSTTYNRELIIVEKLSDGRPFELHSTFEDKLTYTKSLQKPWLFLFIAALLAAVFTRSTVWGVFAALALAGSVSYQVELIKLKKEEKTREW